MLTASHQGDSAREINPYRKMDGAVASVTVAPSTDSLDGLTRLGSIYARSVEGTPDCWDWTLIQFDNHYVRSTLDALDRQPATDTLTRLRVSERPIGLVHQDRNVSAFQSRQSEVKEVFGQLSASPCFMLSPGSPTFKSVKVARFDDKIGEYRYLYSHLKRLSPHLFL